MFEPGPPRVNRGQGGGIETVSLCSAKQSQWCDNPALSELSELDQGRRPRWPYLLFGFRGSRQECNQQQRNTICYGDQFRPGTPDKRQSSCWTQYPRNPPCSLETIAGTDRSLQS